MAHLTFKNGRWLDKQTGEPAELPDKSHTWNTPGTFLIGGEITPYTCPKTGKYISTRYEHGENLKRHGCRVYEKGETQEQLRDRERDFDRACERYAETWVREAAQQF